MIHSRLALIIFTTILCLTQCTNEPIEVGFTSNLSGRTSMVGINSRAGLILALEEINAAGGINGRPLKLSTYDHTGDKLLAQKQVREMVSRSIPLIVGPHLSSMVPLLLTEVNNSQTMLFSPTVSSERYSRIDDNFFRVNTSAKEQGRRIASEVVRRQLQKITLVLDGNNLEYVESVLAGVNDAFKATDHHLSIIKYKTKDSLSVYTNQIIANNPDGIIFAMSGIDAAGICQQLHKSRITAQLFGTMWTKLSQIELYGGKTVEGMILVDSYQNVPQLPQEKRFIESFTKRFNIQPNFASRYAYEVMYLYAQAVDQAGTTEFSQVKQSLLSIKSFNGITDSYSLDMYGDVVRKQSLYQIKDNEYVLLPEIY